MPSITSPTVSRSSVSSERAWSAPWRRTAEAVIPTSAPAIRTFTRSVPEWIPDEALGPQELAERSVTIEEVFAVVEALPAAQREVIQLRFGAGLSIAETAEALDKQQTNVKVLQHKGIKRLKELLDEAQARQDEKQNDDRRRYRRLDR